ncbi:MAG: GGDEF domain-containing protein [Candidatus Nanopelagicales bacterium]
MAYDVDEATALRAAYRATRAILRAPDAASAQRELLSLCRDLGIEVVPGEVEHHEALPLDLSLGEGDPVVPVGHDRAQRLVLERYVVPAVADARLVVERSRRTRHLAERASVDALTGAWSRASLMHAVTSAAAGDALVLLDLDHFKEVNDTWGHAAGDEVLAGFARFLRTTLRGSDVVGRYGGEEFVVLLPATGHLNACATMARLRCSWSQVHPYGVTFSGGVAEVEGSPDGVVPAGIAALIIADALLYEAKRAGRDRVACSSTACRHEWDEAS